MAREVVTQVKDSGEGARRRAWRDTTRMVTGTLWLWVASAAVPVASGCRAREQPETIDSN